MMELSSKSRLINFVTVVVIFFIVGTAIRWLFFGNPIKESVFSMLVGGMVTATVLALWRPRRQHS